MPPRTRSAVRGACATRTKASIADVSSPGVEVTSRVVRVGPRKIPTELITIPSDQSVKAPKYDLVIVPGNPGVPSFYEHYAKTLHALLDGDVDIEIFGYKGHTTDRYADTTGDWFTLQDQLDHLREYLQSRKSRSRHGTVLVGHSIGAEMSLDAMDKLGTGAVRGVVGLMPFVLVNTKSALQKFLSALVHITPLVYLVAAIVGFIGALPGFFKRLAFSPITGTMSASPADLTRRWLRSDSIRNMAFMGRTEFDALTALDTSRWKRHKDRTSLLYCPGDHWAPLHQMEDFGRMKELRGMETVLESAPGVDHAFVLHDKSAELIAQRTKELLETQHAVER